MRRDYREYELTVRQEPKQARMCGVGGKADRRPIDPPPIVQLRVVDPLKKPNADRSGSPATMPPGSPTPSVATTDRDVVPPKPVLLYPDDDAELHWLKDPQSNNEDAGFFVFPDLSVRTEGSYRLKLSLYEVVGYVFVL
ncbi:hypothetical protein BT96DRAFT_956429 [Gymnopus androsaceus JB14]|uniref:Velvet domain-containing protein n=1 Tax=Gymnopus androsaceus JB14 TaxID=1447944 RepID=A0A6A4HX63_9AGAR|nr:hypothetical protein BT96DRAFT_956429 [Gymnopus androsaceus JB14]